MSQTVVITGASSGIGLEFARQYQSAGCEVLALCRKASSELSALGVRVFEGVDVGRAETLLDLDTKIGQPIDLLINNAGVFRNEVLGEIDFDSVVDQLNVNAVGALRVSEKLLSLLRAGSKIALITSRMGSMADNGSGSYYGYRMSKAALNAAGVSLARDLQSRNIAVAILHPGFVQTRMVGFAGDVTTEQSVNGLRQRIDKLNLQNSGTFWHANGEVLPW